MSNDELGLLIVAVTVVNAWQTQRAKKHLERVIMAGQNELDVAIAGLEASETAEIQALQGLQAVCKKNEDDLAASIAAGVQGPDLQAEVDRLNASSARLAAAALAITPGGGGGVGTGGGSGEGGGGVPTGG